MIRSRPGNLSGRSRAAIAIPSQSGYRWHASRWAASERADGSKLISIFSAPFTRRWRRRRPGSLRLRRRVLGHPDFRRAARERRHFSLANKLGSSLCGEYRPIHGRRGQAFAFAQGSPRRAKCRRWNKCGVLGVANFLGCGGRQAERSPLRGRRYCEAIRYGASSFSSAHGSGSYRGLRAKRANEKTGA